MLAIEVSFISLRDEKFKLHLDCAFSITSKALQRTQTDMKNAIDVISLLVIGFLPPIHLCQSIQRVIYQLGDLIGYMLGVNEIGGILKTRLTQIDDLIHVSQHHDALP